LRSDAVSGPTVDILMEPPIDLEAAFSRAQSRDVQGVRVALVAVDDLIRLKEHAGRAQDQADVAHLRRIRGKSE
jgi:predicted nucleotidyltransferase